MNWIQHTTSLASALFNLTSALLGRRILEVWVFALLAGVLNADRVLLAEPPSKTEPPSKKLLTVASIFDSDVYSEDSRSWTWDRHRPILWHLKEHEGDPHPTLVKIEPIPWQEQLVLTPEQMTPQGRTEPLKIDSFEWSADERYLLVFTNSVRVWRAKTRGDYWLWDRHKNVWRQLGGSADAQSLMFATLSPDGKRVGYVATIDGERGLYTEDADSAEVNAIATSRDRNQIYGTFDWVYEEELGLRRGFEFSPDSRRLAFWHLDTTGVPQQTLIDNTSNRYAAIKSFAYPKVGETNAAARIGICDLANNRLTWAKIGGDPREHYLATLHWPPGHDKWLAHGTSDTQSALSSHPASNVCLVQQLNRNQTINRLLAIDAVTGATSEVLRETSRGWVSPQTRLHWMPISSGDIPDLFWLTERNGFRQLERIALSSNWNVHARQLLTPESFDVIAIEAVNQDAKRIVFVASPNDPTRRSLYQVQSDGSDLRCLTPKRDGTYQFDFDSSGTLAIETWSSRSAVPTKRCVSVNPYQVVRELVDNVELQRSLAALPPIHREFIHLPIPVDSRDQTSGEQIELDGWIMMPESARDAAAGSLPLIVYTYGEPFGQTVVDRYGGKKDLWHRMMVQHGFVVASIDNRGTNSPRGVAFRQSIVGKMGVNAPDDQAAAIRHLLSKYPALDPNRVGVWGWSGGGSTTLHMLFRHSDLVSAGVAVAPVSDQRDYDTIYQERYMKSLIENEEAYVRGSPITHVAGLDDPLLIIHGTGDDNVHYTSTARLINRLVAEHKRFDMMIYPGRTHAIREGDGTTVHLRQLMTDFFERHLQPKHDGDQASIP